MMDAATDDFADLPSLVVTLFIQDADLVRAQRDLNALKPGDRRADLAAAFTEAASCARGYRIEFADEPEAAAQPEPAPMAVTRRLGLLGRRP
jgi:hypothetical protein